MIFPTLDTAKRLSRGGNVIPVCKTILADTETPVSVWLKLYRDAPYSFLLESVTGGDKVARYSFIGGNPFVTFSAHKGRWHIRGRADSEGSGDPVERLRALMHGYTAVPVEGIPRFCGGAVGFFGYDSIRYWEEIPDANPDDHLLDDIFFGLYRDLIAFDNREHKLLLISSMILEKDVGIEEAYRRACFSIGGIEDALAVRMVSPGITVNQKGEIESTFEKARFERAVQKCRRYIRAGDIFQVVLSQRFSVGVEADPFNIYRILRTVNPSPYMFYLNLKDAAVVGASPEMLVRLEGGTVEVRPIAGTRRRGRDDADDEAMERELLDDPKEAAEHVMLVDLGRNDIGRVSASGSVRVEEMMHVEKYSHVMHMVTNVSGRLIEGRDAFDVLRACFPAGTLSGAPKIRAMEIIDELEPTRRGLYGGALGYIDFAGNMDSCIVIRTIMYKEGKAYIQAGAGIVADSKPALEYKETVNKARALFTALRDAEKIVGR